MENEWSSMSKQVQLSIDGENFINSVQLQDDNYMPLIVNDFTTLSRYTMVAILLYQSSKTTSSSYSNIALLRTSSTTNCSNSETAVTA
ncbi:hypothetical protein CsSME_00011641 [Camellia sinensis var. sinensis]